MTIQYKNIIFNFNYLKYEDILGEIEFRIPKDLMQEFVKDNNCIPYDEDYLYELPNETFDDYIFEEDYYGINPDTFIVFIRWCLCQEQVKFEIDATYLNVFWLIHDCLHAEHDCSGSTVYVSKEIEKDRLIETFEYLKNNNMNLLNIVEIEKIEDTFYTRWKQGINLEQYKFYEYED